VAAEAIPVIPLLILLAQWADLATFAAAAHLLPIEGEFNPVARWAYEQNGLMGVVGIKVCGTLATLGIVYWLSPVIQRVATVSIVSIALLGSATNLAAILLS
jgi:hypothetical protein